jgi:hypothetical protein
MSSTSGGARRRSRWAPQAHAVSPALGGRQVRVELGDLASLRWTLLVRTTATPTAPAASRYTRGSSRTRPCPVDEQPWTVRQQYCGDSGGQPHEGIAQWALYPTTHHGRTSATSQTTNRSGDAMYSAPRRGTRATARGRAFEPSPRARPAVCRRRPAPRGRRSVARRVCDSPAPSGAGVPSTAARHSAYGSLATDVVVIPWPRVLGPGSGS